ncbi:MAG: small multi-drug export protein, partial [Anaerolineae bacterium]|nr:small multi-drug export protein [Anaerolineae bacterium]
NYQHIWIGVFILHRGDTGWCSLAVTYLGGGVDCRSQLCGRCVVIVLVGAPLRERLTKRFNISTTHDPNKLIWRVWDRYGLIGLSLLAPITLGAQIGALIGLSLGVKPRSLVIGMALGVVPWCVGIGMAVAFGLQVVRTS